MGLPEYPSVRMASLSLDVPAKIVTCGAKAIESIRGRQHLDYRTQLRVEGFRGLPKVFGRYFVGSFSSIKARASCLLSMLAGAISNSTSLGRYSPSAASE
jgi:hypothetical protein